MEPWGAESLPGIWSGGSLRAGCQGWPRARDKNRREGSNRLSCVWLASCTSCPGNKSNNSRGYPSYNIYITSFPLNGIILIKCVYTHHSFIHFHLTAVLIYGQIKVRFYLPCSIWNDVLPVRFYVGLIIIPSVNIHCVLLYDIVFDLCNCSM